MNITRNLKNEIVKGTMCVNQGTIKFELTKKADDIPVEKITMKGDKQRYSLDYCKIKVM